MSENYIPPERQDINNAVIPENAEFYEEETIDRHRLTDWMNSKVAPAIKIESDDEDLVLGAISLLFYRK